MCKRGALTVEEHFRNHDAELCKPKWVDLGFKVTNELVEYICAKSSGQGVLEKLEQLGRKLVP
jgi:hypothetical protein